MVPFGIKVSNRCLIFIIEICLGFIRLGEANSAYNSDKYACSFSKLISYWRHIWNERTNGTTNIQFPFGFVQLSHIHTHRLMIKSNISAVINRLK